MDKNKVAEKIAKEREKAKNLGKTMWVFMIIIGIVGWIAWKWYAFLISIMLALISGSIYSYLVGKRIKRETGMGIYEQELTLIEASYRKSSKKENSFSDEFINKLNMGEEKEKMRPRIYSKTLINRALSLYGKNPEDLEGIYWKLMASCTGESIAKSVCENPMLLELYLKMESEGISDLVIAAKFTRIFNQWQE